MSRRDSERRPAIFTVAFVALVVTVVVLSAVWTRRRPVATFPVTAPAPRPAASVVRVPARGLVVINLGLGDRVVQGHMFDVYDRSVGIPPPAPGVTPPRAKALLEVIRIGPGFSECRVVQKSPGAVVTQGDLVVDPSSPEERLAVQPANSGQSPPLPPPAPAGVDTNPGRS